MTERKVDTLIVGAGITGLSAALAMGGDVLILEKETEPGGYCRSFRHGDWLWDCAGHFFHFRSDEMRQLFLRSLGPENVVEKRKCAGILYHGARIDAPFQTHLHQLPKEDLLDCLYDLVFREEKEHYDSFLAMLHGRYGRSVTEKFLRPYNEKLYACDLGTLDAGAMGRFFPQADLSGILAAWKQEQPEGYNSRFLYPKLGAGSFTDALYGRLDPSRVLLGRTLVSLEPQRHVAVDSAGQSYRYRRLINTSPLDRFLPLLGEGGKAAARRLSCNKVLVLNLGFEKKSPFRREHWL